MIKVENMKGRTGRPVQNQFVIRTPEGSFFQSHETVIAYIPLEGKVQLDFRSWDHSAATGKYRNIFLNETKTETQAKINSGEYELVNLNSMNL